MSEKKKGSEEMLCPLWMMTFGDCMSLLVTFFVMLIAFSNMEEEQLLDMVGAMKGALGMTPGRSTGEIVQIKASEKTRGLSEEKVWLTAEDLSSVIPSAKMLTKRFGKPKAGAEDQDIVVTMLDEGLAFIINVNYLFESGTATLLKGNDDLLRQVGDFAERIENEVRIVSIMGKSSAIHSAHYKTPLGLGIERASSLKRAFSKHSNIKPERFGIGSQIAASDIGEIQELATAEHIEIIIIGRRALEELTPEEIVIRDKWN